MGSVGEVVVFRKNEVEHEVHAYEYYAGVAVKYLFSPFCTIPIEQDQSELQGDVAIRNHLTMVDDTVEGLIEMSDLHWTGDRTTDVGNSDVDIQPDDRNSE